MQIWYASIDSSKKSLLDCDITKIMSAAGIQALPLKNQHPSGPGIVFFEKYSRDLHEALISYSGNGFERVIAVALSPKSLSHEETWQILEAGASDVILFDGKHEFLITIAEKLKRWRAVDEIINSGMVSKNLIGKSRSWISVLRRIVEIAKFTRSSVLITGESGTGKELVARLIHTLDARPSKRELIVLDCTTINPSLSGSEFFGHEKGAFTNALSARDGAFALADGGTLFLDEVGELPPALQAELLRVTQERMFKRLGSNKWQKTDFRLICATNRDLLKEEKTGAFRRDFYYRIASWNCYLPPLRERREDIFSLAEHFFREVRPEGPAPEFDPAVKSLLLEKDYPGNIRDLRQFVRRLAWAHVGQGSITVGAVAENERLYKKRDTMAALSDDFRSVIRRAINNGVGLKGVSNMAADIAVETALLESDGNLREAAAKLGVTDRALQMRRASRKQ